MKKRTKSIKEKSKKQAVTRKKLSKYSAKKSAKLSKKQQALEELNQQSLHELIERGKSRGFVTDSEVLHHFPNIEENVSFLEKVYDELEKANIKVVETNQLIELPKDEVSDKELERAIEVPGMEELPDAVQMYLRQIGKTPLLTQAEEKELAKRIEKGDEESRLKFMQAN
ncbi:MAG TPA: sigma-70 factor domain-containing protein, partial [Candidatus Paceibacterota bacterium]